MLRLGNPFVRAILRSRAHRLLSSSLAVLEYEGRRTRTRHAIPVVYAEDGGSIIALAANPERKQWWRTFREPSPATLLVRGEHREVVGRVLDGAERRAALRAYLALRPRAARPLGVGDSPADDEVDTVRAAVVAFRPLDLEGLSHVHRLVDVPE